MTEFMILTRIGLLGTGCERSWLVAFPGAEQAAEKFDCSVFFPEEFQ
jgi:hypothetical protein